MTPQTDIPGTTQPLAAAPARGYTTTEFGVTIASLLGMASGLIPQQYVPLVAGVAGVYVACRTLLKAAHALGYAKSIPDLPALPPGSTTITTVPRG